MGLKITTLIENMQDEKGQLTAEHGFSVFIETEKNKLLFDTGQSGAFIRNAEILGINPADADAVVLSHGHYDHTGGVPLLIQNLKKKTPFYIGNEFFQKKYKRQEDGTLRYNGNPFPKEMVTGHELAECHYIGDGVTKLSEDMFLFKNFARVMENEKVNPNFLVETKNGIETDLFADEIALGIKRKEGLILLVGCSHAGIGNILHQVTERMNIPVAAVVGGTHLVEADGERLSKTAEMFQHYGVKWVAVSHCTGEAGMNLLQKQFGGNFTVNRTGTVLEFD